MAHVFKEKNEIYKSYKLKVRNYKGDVDIKSCIAEYDRKFNNVSHWISSHLTSMTIGEAVSKLNPAIIERGSKYAQVALSDEWKEQPLYKVFLKQFGGLNADNLLINCTRNENGCEFDKSVSMGFSESVFRTFGFAAAAVSDMKTRMTSVQTRIRRSNVTEDSDDEVKLLQCLYEMQNNQLSTETDWKDYISYLEMKEYQERTLDRIKILYDYYTKNKSKVSEKLDLIKIEILSKFSGSERKSGRKTLTLNGINYQIQKKEGFQGFLMSFCAGKNHRLEFDLYGHRALLRNGENIVDIINNHSSQVSIELDGDDMYVILSAKISFDKKESDLKNIVGVDMNIKHMLMMTSVVDDGNIKNYVNLYKEILSDDSFRNILNKEETSIFTDLSKYVTFGVLETPYLGSRVLDTNAHDKLVEDRITSSLKNLASKLSQEGRNRDRIYVQSVLKMRALLKVFISKKLSYSNKHKEYDLTMGFMDDDPRRKTEGFHTTEIGIILLNEIDCLSKKIVACRDAIVEYGYYVLKTNGYDTISIENLERSSFMDNRQVFPTCGSMLGWYHLEGKDVDEAMNDIRVGKFLRNGYYDLKIENGKIVGMDYSEKGESARRRKNLYDMIIKAVHFADVKDKFVELSNNGSASIVIVPPYFSSQMDSVSHKVFTEDLVVVGKDKKGKQKETVKTVLVDKHKVRRTQETHMNGMNADYNAARNLAYTASEWRESLCFKTWNGYGEPFWDSKIKNPKTMIDRLGRLGALEKIN